MCVYVVCACDVCMCVCDVCMGCVHSIIYAFTKTRMLTDLPHSSTAGHTSSARAQGHAREPQRAGICAATVEKRAQLANQT